MSQKKSQVVSHLRKAQIAQLLMQGRRLDGRGLLEYRPIKVENGVIGKAEGSAKVSIGNTQVIAGVKVGVGPPFPDTPDQGLLVVNTEVLPLASPYAEPGPPDENAVELARVVDRGVRESQMIDLSKLVLTKGKHVYTVFADVSVLDIDGNLFDTISYAVVASLLTSSIPKHVVEEDSVKATAERFPLPIRTIPISVTMARIGDVMIVDPTSEEESVMDSIITFAVDGDGNICAGQKGNSGTLTSEQVIYASEVALSKAPEIRGLIEKVIHPA